MDSGIKTIWNVLRPHARAHRSKILLLVGLAWLFEISQKAVILLLPPALEVLSPGQSPTKPLAQASWWSGAAKAAEHWLVRDAVTDDELLMACVRVGCVVAGLALFSALTFYCFLTLSRWIALHVPRHALGGDT